MAAVLNSELANAAISSEVRTQVIALRHRGLAVQEVGNQTESEELRAQVPTLLAN